MQLPAPRAAGDAGALGIARDHNCARTTMTDRASEAGGESMALDDIKIHVKLKLSALWASVMFCIFLGVVEVALTALIVWYAWNWPRQEAILSSHFSSSSRCRAKDRSSVFARQLVSSPSRLPAIMKASIIPLTHGSVSLCPRWGRTRWRAWASDCATRSP